MSANRTLWVEDGYAPRCRRCNARFTLLRRRHHCRQCGQVFCSNCLIQSPSSVSNAVISAVTSWMGVGDDREGAGQGDVTDVNMVSAYDQRPAKLCYHCATLLARGGLGRRDATPRQQTRGAAVKGSVAGRVSSACASATVAATMDKSASSVTVNEPPATLQCTLSSSTTQQGPDMGTTQAVTLLASPVIRHTRIDPNACYTALTHSETAEERAVTFCVEELPPVAPPPRLLRRSHVFVSQSGPATPNKSTMAAGQAEPASPTSVLPSLSPPSSALSSCGRPAIGLAALAVNEDEVCGDVPLWDATCSAHLQARLRLLLREVRRDVCDEGADRATECSGQSATQSDDVALVRRLSDVVCEAVRSVVVPLGSHVLHHLHVRCVTRYERVHDTAGDGDWSSGLEMRVVPGLVICRAVTSRRMRTHIVQPRLLILAGEVSSPVQPTDDLLEYVTSYKGYLDKLFARITAWRPDMIVVEKGMHHYLQKCIADAGGMTLLLHVGEAQMRQLAVASGAAIVSDLQYVSLEEIRNDAVLGRCARFDVVAFRAQRGDVSQAEQSSSVTAQDVHMCVFQGLPCPVYVTVLLRSPSPAALRGLARLVRVGVVVAQHIAMQQHLLHDLSLVTTATEQNTSETPPFNNNDDEGDSISAAAALTMNVGLHWPEEVQVAMRNDNNASRCRDTLMVNTILLDRLYHDGGAAASSRPTAALGEADSSLFGSASNTASPVVAAVGTSSPAVATGMAAAAVSYSVQQRRGSMHFYAARDESLLSFLSARCAQGGSQLLFVHGPCRVLVTTTAATTTTIGIATAHTASSPTTALQSHAPPSAATASGLAGCGDVAQLGCPLYVKHATPSSAQQQRGATSQHYARQLRRYRVVGAAAGVGADAEGVWGPQLLDLQRMQGLYCGCAASRVAADSAASHAASSVPMTLRLCSPHSLNVSFAAFLEFVVYGLSRCRVACNDTAPPLGLPCSVVFVLQPGEEGQVEVRLAVSAIVPSRIDLPLPCAHYDSARCPTNTSSTMMIEQGTLYLQREKDELLAYLDTVRRAVQTLQDSASVINATATLLKSPRAEGDEAPQIDNQLAMRTTELQSAAREAASVEDLTNLRWRQLRPLVHDVLTALRTRAATSTAQRPGEAGGVSTMAALASALGTPPLWYCAETSQSVWVNDVSSIVALALGRWWQQAGRRADTEATPHLPRPCPSSATVGPDASATHPLLTSRSSSAATTEATRESDEKTHGDDPVTIRTMTTRESRATLSEHDEDDGSSSTTGTTTHVSLRRTLSGAANRGRHTRYVFSELFSGSGGCEDSQRPTIDVELLFANEFAALQMRYTKGHPDCLLASLRHSRTFHADGGKTRADFFITEDRRYLLKRIKSMELRHFSTLGAHYFRHLQTMQDGDNTAADSALGKVLGLYTVRVQATSQAQQQQQPGSKSEVPFSATLSTQGEPQYYVLMEYLFHDCIVDAMYDLKGSQRNRTTGDGAAVRLDVDLVQQLRQGNFLFCSEEDKSRLMRVVGRDVGMLTEAAVMDYSLVAACDRTGRRIQVGIIDYLHPYNSAKVLESKVKSGLDTVLGHNAHRPTIIDPDHYEQRFLRWIAGYFCAVPQRLTAC